MKKLAGNDMLEYYLHPNGQVMHHPRLTMDARAHEVFKLLTFYGQKVETDKDGVQTHDFRPAGEVVNHCCELVDAAFMEIERRGWAVLFPLENAE